MSGPLLIHPMSQRPYHTPDNLPDAVVELERLRTEVAEQRAQSERLASAGRLVAMLLHELGNPVSAIVNYAHMLEGKVTPELKHINVPTLYTVGEFDEADPPTVKRFAGLTPGAHVVVLKGAAHMTPWDAREENVKVVREFLRAVDSSRTRKSP